MRHRLHLLATVLLTAFLAGCESAPVTPESGSYQPLSSLQTSATLSKSDFTAPAPPAMPEGVSYAGGDGSSVARAVIVNGVKTDRASTRAEYAYLRNRYPGFHRKQQALVRSAGRYYDALTFDLPGGESKTVYFDITATFGKR